MPEAPLRQRSLAFRTAADVVRASRFVGRGRPSGISRRSEFNSDLTARAAASNNCKVLQVLDHVLHPFSRRQTTLRVQPRAENPVTMG